MSADSSRAVVIAFAETLRADATLAALIGDRVFLDFPPAMNDSHYPCVVLGEMTCTPWDTDEELGAELIVEFRAYGKGAKARDTVLQVQERVTAVLHDCESSVVVDGHDLVASQLLETRSTRDDGAASSTMRFRVLTTAT